MSQPHPEITLYPANISTQYQEALEQIITNDVLSRLRAHDYTLWSEIPDEIINRLDWLELPQTMLPHLDEISTQVDALIDEGFDTAVLLGMGGSSLAPEVYSRTFGKTEGFLDLLILDTTDSVTIRNLKENLDLEKTVFIVATKSGGTVETLSLFKYFYSLYDPAHASRNFIAITDPGSNLETLAEELDFRKAFLNNPNLGGRYSALSHFGLFPAALLGIDLVQLLCQAGSAAAGEASAAQIGALIGAGALTGRDKLTFITDEQLNSFSDWAEQLIAESTGKDNKGIVPIVGERLADDLDLYSTDRLFVIQYLGENPEMTSLAEKLSDTGHPVIEIGIPDISGFGFLIMVWETATAISGHLMEIHPFNQPDVESAKVLARNSIQDYHERGEMPKLDSTPLSGTAIRDFLNTAAPGDYISIQAYLSATSETSAAFRDFQHILRDKTQLAVTFGFGPRFLHSTGQLHKGDRGNGWFIRFVSQSEMDLPIPDQAGSSESSISFNALKMSQAIGDGQALEGKDRPVLTFMIEEPFPEAIQSIISELEK